MKYELGYVEIFNDKYKVFNSSLDASEISLNVDEYYAIFVKEDDYDSSDIEIESHYIANILSERNDTFYVFAFEDYQSYIFELSSLSDKDEV